MKPRSCIHIYIKNDIYILEIRYMNLEAIQSNPTSFLQKAKKKEIIDLLKQADDAFFKTGDTILSDDIYDIIKDYVRERYPKEAYLKRVGADENNKVRLPYYMGSQNKIRDDESEIKKFQAKFQGPFVISDKLDGISCLITADKGSVKIYTRGNGTEGQDISHIADLVLGIPVNSLKSSTQSVAVRGELILSKKSWDALKGQGVQGANARNLVAGAINSKILNRNIMSKIEFVAYNLVSPKMKVDESLQFLKSHRFKVVRHTVSHELSLNLLSEYLQRWRDNSEYVIDGIVVSDNNIHNIVKGINPDYAFAFKSIHTHEQVEVIVTGVEWNVSKDKYMKPIVKFNEIDLDGVKIKQATGFNAAFIEKHKIGAGSRIIIIRSGNVIPHIMNVLTPSATNKPSFPQVSYTWNDTHVDIILLDEKNRDHDIKNITYFMKVLDVDHMGAGNITKIYDTGFDTIKKIVSMTKNDLLQIDGFKEKSATNILTALAKIKDVDCLSLMDASNMLGRGFSAKKIKMITDVYPFVLKHDKKSRKAASDLTVADLVEVDGIAEVSAALFLDNLPKFYEFYDNLGIRCSEPGDNIPLPLQIPLSSNIKGKSFVFSGFRNKDLEAYIERSGGFVKTSVSKNTDYLVTADKNERSAKVMKAEDLGIKILSPNVPEPNDKVWKELFGETATISK
jgi:NAD-dependent DNA ligase